MPERLDEEELADWRAGRNAVYQLAALTVARASRSRTHEPSIKGAALGGACGVRAPLCEEKTPAGEAGAFVRTSEGEKLDRPGNL
jgi:hypothetical protein